MICRRERRFVQFNEAGFEDADPTGSRAADLVAQLADAAVPANPRSHPPPDAFVPPAMVAALALPVKDVLTRLGLGAFAAAARKSGVFVARDLLRNELGMVSSCCSQGALSRLVTVCFVCVGAVSVWRQRRRAWRPPESVPSRGSGCAGASYFPNTVPAAHTRALPSHLGCCLNRDTRLA